jgi:hypothetical protein
MPDPTTPDNRLLTSGVARKRKQVGTEALANKMARISIFVMLVSISCMT